MHRKNKQGRALDAWRRTLTLIFEKQDPAVFLHKIYVTKHNHGECPAYMWYALRTFMFHTYVVPKWLKDTNINSREKLIDFVEQALGHGYVNELNAISRKRTW